MKKTLIFAIAVAGVFTFASSVHAADVVMSPRAKEQANSWKTVPGITADMIDRSIKSAPPKVIAQQNSLRTVPSTGQDIDLAHAPRPTLSPKDPNYAMALRENALKQLDVQVAPLK